MQEIKKYLMSKYDYKLLKKHESIILVLQENYSNQEIKKAFDNMKKKDGKIEPNKLVDSFDYYLHLFKTYEPDFFKNITEDEKSMFKKYYNEITLETPQHANIPIYYDFPLMNLLNKLYTKNVSLLYLSFYIKERPDIKTIDQLKFELNQHEKIKEACEKVENRIKGSDFYKCLMKNKNIDQGLKEVSLYKKIKDFIVSKGFKRLTENTYLHKKESVRFNFVGTKFIATLKDGKEVINEEITVQFFNKLKEHLRSY